MAELYGPDMLPLFTAAVDLSAGVAGTTKLALLGSALFANNGTLFIPLKGDATTGLVVAPNTAANNDADGVSNTTSNKLANLAGLTAYIRNLPMLFNGAGWDRQRGPAIFKVVALAAATAEATIWTPGAGKKFRLLGFLLTTGAGSTLTFKDNTSGTTIFAARGGTDVPIHCPPLGNGILSAAANNVLTVTRGTSATLDGVVWGTEE